MFGDCYRENMSKNAGRVDNQDQQQQQLLQREGDIYNIREAYFIIFKSTIMMDKDIREI
jgi:hypothetical protein